MSAYFRFVVPGEPRPKARARVVNGHGFTPRATRVYENKVRWVARANRVKRLRGPVTLFLAFYLGNARRLDLDNLVKTLKDGLNGIAWDDDSQVVELHASKATDPADPRVVVTVQAAEGA